MLLDAPHYYKRLFNLKQQTRRRRYEVMNINSVENFKQISELEHVMGLALNPERCLQKLIFWSHELKQNFTENSSVEDKILAINHFLFEQKNISLTNSQLISISLESTLKNKKANFCTLGLIYRTLAELCGIELHFIKLKPFSILKYVDTQKTIYLNIEMSGQQSTLEEMIQIISPLQDSISNTSNQLFDKMESQQILKFYGKFLSGARFNKVEFKKPLNPSEDHGPEADL